MVERAPVPGEPSIEQRLAELEQEMAALRGEAEQRRLILESAIDYAIFTIDRKGFVTTWNNGAERLLGFREDEIIGKDGRVIFTPEDRKKGAAEWEINQALATGRATNERWHVRKDGNRFWGSGLIMPLKHGGPGLLKIMRDETERRRSDELRKLLIGELDHRVKNMLAMVRSLADQTLENVDSLAAFKKAFTSRLFALAGAHDLLTRETWVSADLENLVYSALQSWIEDGRVEVSGPPIRIGPKQALALSMALNELATNAAKYGALSAAGGRVELTWRRERGECEIRWTERGGPPVSPPSRHGFGMRILNRALAMELERPVELLFDPEGVTCVISVALARGDQQG
jgi:PAS domain S-box-containing protein